ncbi:NADH-quinone oxidoreductase subunit NuoN [Palleronia sp.]|uniref:NADH-quinone oxidoreductase subunit NuoN n=1 Tax=Palleronia sp. TaxID=1940284 RepID=UPI0035C7CCCE
MSSVDFSTILPELALALYAMGALLGVVYTGKDRFAPMLVWVTAAVFLFFAFWIGVSGPIDRIAFRGLFIDDAFARFAKVTILLSAAAVLVMSQGYMERRGILRFEYPLLVTLSVVGMMVMVSAGDLMTLYMGLELQSLAVYVIASLRRDSARSTEAGLKYFVLGSLSSGLLLYGASLTYGFAGTTLFAGIILSAEGQASLGLLFGLVFITAGLAFKVSAAPFHMWTPDVYEGAPTPVTAFLATAPKVAAMGLFARVVFDAFGGIVGDWQQIIAALSVVSMFLGAVAAIGQTDIKRLMAYSSINHMGFALMGLAAGTAFGVQAMLIYMAIYVTMNIGTFAFILSMERDGKPVTSLRSLNMLSRKDPARAYALAALMWAMGGLPPLMGFWGKFYVFSAAVESGLGWLALLGGIASAIALYYYLRIVYLMFFGEETEGLDQSRSPLLTGVAVASALVMVVGIATLFGVEGAAVVAASALVH